MHDGLSLVLAWGLAAAAVAQGVATVGRQRAFGDGWTERLAAERRLLGCARLAAFERNLVDAAALATGLDPGGAEHFAAARAAAWEEATNGASELPDADGRCAEAAADGLASRLHRQDNPRLNALWPNWVARYEWKDGRAR